MGLALISFIQNHWPFAPRKLTDIELSDRLVSNLDIPEHTKKFVFAIIEPETQSIVYVLSAQNLSKQSAVDAEVLIKEVRPEAVVTQVGSCALAEIRTEEENCRRSDGDKSEVGVPTSAFGVLKGCFVDKIGKEKYESLAGSVLMKEIFGVRFYGHFFAAEKAAKEVGSDVFFIESPFVRSCGDESGTAVDEGKSKLHGLGLNSSSLVPQNVSSKRLFLTSDLHSETLKSFVSALLQFNEKPKVSSSVSEEKVGDLRHDYEVPSFAQSVYPLLIDLHNVFGNLPPIKSALVHAQRMFSSVDKGETVDKQLLSEVQGFQIAVEGLRIGLNSAGRSPIDKAEKTVYSKLEFSKMPTEDKSYALFAQAIRSQTQKFKSVVAIVDANSLAGLRKHWNTPLPPEVKDLIKQFITKYEDEEEMSGGQNSDKKSLIADKPVVAVGAGATALLGTLSFSKAVPASTLVKLAPASLKLGLVQTQKVMAIAFTKVLGPSKVIAHGLVTSGAKSTLVMKATASANKVRAVTHSIRAYAQRTSFSATRTAFYEIMRTRRFQPVGSMPWIKLGCSISTCAGLLAYGDGIECALESLPVAPSIASLGRGLQSLHKANEVVGQEGGTHIQEAMQALMYRFKK